VKQQTLSAVSSLTSPKRKQALPAFSLGLVETAHQEKKLAGLPLLVFSLINKKRLAFCFKVCCFFRGKPASFLSYKQKAFSFLF
jgi:hypothetical protein